MEASGQDKSPTTVPHSSLIYLDRGWCATERDRQLHVLRGCRFHRSDGCLHIQIGSDTKHHDICSPGKPCLEVRPRQH